MPTLLNHVKLQAFAMVSPPGTAPTLTLADVLTPSETQAARELMRGFPS